MHAFFYFLPQLFPSYARTGFFFPRWKQHHSSFKNEPQKKKFKISATKEGNGVGSKLYIGLGLAQPRKINSKREK